ncbi:DUF6056 family protein [Streptomyces sp. CB03238]|uniref:DUF6056 family protein n=1 Tax=Streptomyces sp. CB03238 TaxID=1907777 RepID=UPI000A106760|nr:DUF6056 family protein [Streptomyces sp. CB03238]ORT55982.1 hypothetical protein BKD26_30440 [Streptomyces sp. CB03238]
MAVGASSVTVPPDPGKRPGPGREKGGGDPRGSRTTRTTAWTAGLALLPLGLLAAASYLGRYVRPSADEWCFLPVVRDQGIWGLVGKFYVTDNGRIANGLLVGLYAEFPVAGHQWYAVISGVLMLVLLWAVTVHALRAAGQRVPRGVPLLIASMITAVFLFATPNTYKTFYWPAASVSHTLAPVLACAAAIPLLRARARRGRIAALAVVFAAGVFMGTLSEEASVVALVVLAVAVLCAPLLFTERVRSYVRGWALVGMAGVAIGTFVLMTSPGSRNRRQRYDAETVSVLAPESLIGSLRAYVRILETVFTTWQYVGAVAAGVLLGLLARRRTGHRPVLMPCRPLLLAALGAVTFLACGYLCTAITYPAFGERVVRTERTWNDWLLVYVLLLVGLGALLGRALRLRGGGRTGVVTALAAAVCAVSVLGLVAPLYHLGHDMKVRAQKWDRQDQWLREQAASGAKVAPYKPLSVGRMLEPFGDNGRRPWPARCVADYYHLDRVTHGTRLP